MERMLIAYCGVDCAPCPDYHTGECPGCRQTEWGDDPCLPVGCCRGRGISCCGECADFPCETMRGFYAESASHGQAFALMNAVHQGLS